MSPPAPVRVKLCGFTRPADAAAAVRAGADYLGLNFWPRSKRFVSGDAAAAVAEAARAAGPVTLVGLFVDQAEAEIVATAARLGLAVVQLHGDEAPALGAALAAHGLEVWKAHAVAGAADVARLGAWPAAAHLLDAPSAGRGGSGQTFDWALAARAVADGHRVVLAGGLTPANVAAAVAVVRPWAVDTASGVEQAPGLKDADKMAAFVAAVRAAARRAPSAAVD